MPTDQAAAQAHRTKSRASTTGQKPLAVRELLDKRAGVVGAGTFNATAGPQSPPSRSQGRFQGVGVGFPLQLVRISARCRHRRCSSDRKIVIAFGFLSSSYKIAIKDIGRAGVPNLETVFH